MVSTDIIYIKELRIKNVAIIIIIIIIIMGRYVMLQPTKPGEGVKKEKGDVGNVQPFPGKSSTDIG